MEWIERNYPQLDDQRSLQYNSRAAFEVNENDILAELRHLDREYLESAR